MMSINRDELTSGYRERMRRLALMDSLVVLGGKRTEDLNGKRIDMQGFGMLTLLFFFERRLAREYETSAEHLTLFLLEMARDIYHIDKRRMERIARDLITNFRPSSGKKRAFTFFNWEINDEETIEYSILKDNGFDAKTQTQFYTLDEDGLELLFATKEFYSEFQISINQLLLKQQIQKGEFNNALRQIREMEIDVDTLRERIEDMENEIRRTIVSEETFDRYQRLLDETIERLEREDEEFKALQQFIRETRDMIYSGDIEEHEEKSRQLIVRIARELEAVHYEHAELISLTVNLRNTALTTAQETLYYTGVQSFNFDQDIVSMILSKPLSPDVMKGVIHPFLKVEQNPIWSPLTLLAEQTIVSEREEAEIAAFIAAEDDSQLENYQKWLGEKYEQIMEKLLTAYDKGYGNTLADFIQYLESNDGGILHERYFYSFWLLIHHHSPLTADSLTDHDSETVLQGVLKLLGSKTFIVEELPDIVHRVEKYSIQNMAILLEEDIDELYAT